MLAAPLSITYAILRHRLFDVSFIIRQWLRYALARWTAISVPPVLGDLSCRRPSAPPPETIAAVLQRRGTTYFAIALAATAAYAWRQRWLDAIDRRFFRERHDGYVVLREVAQHLRRAAASIGSLHSSLPRSRRRCIRNLPRSWPETLANRSIERLPRRRPPMRSETSTPKPNSLRSRACWSNRSRRLWTPIAPRSGSSPTRTFVRRGRGHRLDRSRDRTRRNTERAACTRTEAIGRTLFDRRPRRPRHDCPQHRPSPGERDRARERAHAGRVPRMW